MADHVEIIVRGVLIHEGRLLVCRNRKHGHLFLPGGHVDFNEPASEALRREAKEELGVDLAVGEFLGACEAAFDQVKGGSTRRHQEVNLVFKFRVSPGFKPEALTSQENHIAFDWLPMTEATATKLLPKGILSLLNGQLWVSAFE